MMYLRRFSTGLLSILFLNLAAGVPHAQQWYRGITEPYQDATLGSTVTGVLVRINAKEGDSVRRGQTILELERTNEELEVERRRLIASSKAEITAIDRRLEWLRDDVEKTRKLYESTRSVSLDELRQKELELRLAEAELDRLLAAEEREEIEYKIAQAQLEKRRITAPFDGIVVKVHPEVGELCYPQEPLVRLADLSRCRLVVHLQAADSRGLRKNQPATVTIDGSRAQIPAAIEYVSPVVDPSSGLREVKVLFDNSNGSVNPGSAASVLFR
jgi:RND family efflux transporter MFP subunit